MEHHYWRAKNVYLYRTTYCCPTCGYSEARTASEANVMLQRGEKEKRSMSLSAYLAAVGTRAPRLRTIVIEADQQLTVCPECFELEPFGTPAYSTIFAPASDRLPEEIEQEIAEKRKVGKMRRKEPDLGDLLEGI